ncbi:response regulator transcription factor [Methylobacterium soli]|uniref:Response regulator transcription factor n=1 Tax=Methylobacterium soli TaxID=553447 RepID=A0A6L3STR0_9HYPH|nr:response regulator transcription factor [Methylobacterium soli]KAB1075445.1 response regulator transcription factor [Methylobacterium soli]GJE43279.1 Transcriptional regulatory protein DegU [Methylobacterium soli]
MAYDVDVPTVLVTASSLARQGLVSFLDETHFRIVEPVIASNEVDETRRARLAPLLILSALEDVQSVEMTRAQHVAYPEAKLVIFGQPGVPAILPGDLCSAANGILAYDTARETLISALDLVMSGAKVHSPALLSKLFEETQQHTSTNTGQQSSIGNQSALDMLPETNRVSNHALSRRELDILRCLEDGSTNKMIAQRLSMSECTVKVHIKSIMRKVPARNRTQAAIWARDHRI